MKHLRIALPLTLILLLAACGGTEPPPAPPPPDTTPVPVPPVITPVPTPIPPEQPTTDVPYYGEWIVTYTSEYDVSFVHALQITTNVSDEGLLNAGGGLQELCTEGGADICGGTYGSGFGFMGELVLDDGTSPLSMGIFTQYDNEAPELKIFTLEPIVFETNGQGQQTFTADAAWALSSNDLDFGTIVATRLGEPRTLDPLQLKRASLGEAQLRQRLSR